MRTLINMEGDSGGHIEKIKEQISGMDYDDSAIFQSAWIRRNPVLVDRDDWKPLARQFRYVFYSGIILWAIYAFSLAIA